MSHMPEDGTHLEHRLRALLTEEGQELHVGGVPSGDIVQQGRKVRRRRQTVIGAGLSVLLAVPAGALAMQSLQDTPAQTSATGEADAGIAQPGAAPQDTGDTGGSSEEPVPGQPQPPSDPERQLLDDITLEEARAQLSMCLDEYGFSGDVGRLDDERLEVDPADLQILLAWQGHGGENQGPGPIRRVLAVTVSGDVHAELVCSQSMDEAGGGTGMRSSIGPEAPTRTEVIESLWGRYHTPEMGLDGDWESELPFHWALFDAVDEEAVDKVTVEYGGETQEALIDGGFFLSTGVLDAPADAHPTVLGYDANGEVIFDSRDHPRP